MRLSSVPGEIGLGHLRSAPIETPIGELWVTVSDRGVREISRHAPTAAVPEPDAVAEVADQLRAYFAARRQAFDLALDLDGVRAFDRAIWKAARTVAYGATVSYGELAMLAGHPGAARAAGGSMARCRLFPIVPCHRVIHADGSIKGWGGEAWVKRWLLAMEAAAVSAREAVPRLPL